MPRTRLQDVALAALVILTAFFSTQALAQIYKWVDEKGVTHYSSTPPTTSNARQLPEAAAPPPAEAEAARERARNLIDDARCADVERRRLKSLEDEARATRARNAAASASACGRARQQLDVLESQRPVFRRDEAGKRVYLEDRLRDEEIGRQRAEVERLCADADPEASASETERQDWQARMGELCLRRIEELKALERPELRASRADIERARAAIEQACGHSGR